MESGRMIQWSEEKGPGHTERVSFQRVDDGMMVTVEFYYEPENEYEEVSILMPMNEFRKLLERLRKV